ncbi:alpha/beta fold hydrolase [Telmatospirillum sp. J64-1]|uniref:alpha/beta fold hydrolase n=1 Tax=Telmatospirillum sp. J64-1 TaxID=2502183 RepID=UPI00115C449B|nr:alpha/beta hydrolase [Telmatospirillum sp. J64-1]
MDVLARNNVKVFGSGSRAMVFAHGYGCDQTMWRFVAPAFAETHRIVLFDHVGCGASDLEAYDAEKYGTLSGYAEDVLEICAALDITDGIFVGHSVSAMIGILAANKDRTRFSDLVLVGPSPCYVNKDGYIGGFAQEDIDDLLETLDDNYLGWSSAIAPVIMGNADRPELAQELTNSFCRTDPEISKHFAHVTFRADNRADLQNVTARTLVLQCSEDVIAPYDVGEYVHRMIPRSRFVMMNATGHCPNLSAPEETITAIRSFLMDQAAETRGET